MWLGLLGYNYWKAGAIDWAAWFWTAAIWTVPVYVGSLLLLGLGIWCFERPKILEDEAWIRQLIDGLLASLPVPAGARPPDKPVAGNPSAPAPKPVETAANDFGDLLAGMEAKVAADARSGKITAAESRAFAAGFQSARAVWQHFRSGQAFGPDGQRLAPLTRAECTALMKFVLDCTRTGHGNKPVRSLVELEPGDRKLALGFVAFFPFISLSAEARSLPVVYLSSAPSSRADAREFWACIPDGPAKAKCQFKGWEAVFAPAFPAKCWVLGDLDWPADNLPRNEAEVERAIRHVLASGCSVVFLHQQGLLSAVNALRKFWSLS